MTEGRWTEARTLCASGRRKYSASLGDVRSKLALAYGPVRSYHLRCVVHRGSSPMLVLFRTAGVGFALGVRRGALHALLAIGALYAAIYLIVILPTLANYAAHTFMFVVSVVQVIADFAITLVTWIVTSLGALASALYVAIKAYFGGPEPPPPPPSCQMGYYFEVKSKSCVQDVPPQEPGAAVVVHLSPIITSRGETVPHLVRFSASCTWDIKREDNMLCTQQKDGVDTTYPFLPLLRYSLRQMPDELTLVVIGTASEEGKPATQEALANRRSVYLAGLLRDNIGGHVQIYALNLGQYTPNLKCRDCTPSATAWQRPILILGLTTRLSPTELHDTIMMLVNRKTEFPLDPSQYSIKSPVLSPIAVPKG